MYGRCADPLAFMSQHSLTFHKIKSPRDSPAHCSLNDRIRSKTFPKDQDTLFSLADPLSSNTSFDPDAMFDEMTLKESVCFIVTTSSAEIMPPALASTVCHFL